MSVKVQCRQTRVHPAFMRLVHFAFLTGFPLLIGASLLAATKPFQIEITPRTIALTGPSDSHGILVTAIAPDGRRTDITDRSSIRPLNPAIVSVDRKGACRPISDGETDLEISYAGVRQRIHVQASKTGIVTPPSFKQDVLPILTRFGCNSGPCHGKLAGQNGFKLSLRAFAPEWDVDWLTKDIHSRRLNFADPDESLILLKALAKVPHEGGQRFPEGSRPAQLLRDWIAARAPGPITNELDAAQIEILPGDRAYRVGETQRLLVRAKYDSGRVRDVTWLCKFVSNDETVAKVTESGTVRTIRAGETSVRVHFQGLVGVVSITIPRTNAVPHNLFAARNNSVDDFIFAKLDNLRIPPSPLCDDAAFIRRASLDVTGTIPTPARVREFIADKSADKRARLVEELLASAEYVDFWTLQLCDLLQNRKERDHDVRGSKGVRAFQSWIRYKVAANRPWDEIAREVLTASGDAVTTPQIGYFVTTVGEKKPEESELPDSAAQSFLGTRIGCARCHNHPLERYTQDDFYHFAAFFSKVSLKRTEPMNGRTELSSISQEEEQKSKQIRQIEKALEEARAASTKAAVDEIKKSTAKVEEQSKKLESARKELARAREKMPGVTQPRTKKFMAPQALDRSDPNISPGEDPRLRLAAWITSTNNTAFTGSIVNRLWRHYMGTGLVEPVDDLRASNPPSNPGLHSHLASDFAAHGYDLKHTMRQILNSRAYQLSSETLPENKDDARFYSHFRPRRLAAEVLDDAIAQTTGMPDSFTGNPLGMRAIQLADPAINSYFLTLFGRSERVTACACERNGDVTLPQLLHLNNGDDLLKKIQNKEGRLAAILKQFPDTHQAVTELFYLTLGHEPRASDFAEVDRLIAAGDKREEVLQDLFWALLNSKDFAFNH